MISRGNVNQLIRLDSPILEVKFEDDPVQINVRQQIFQKNSCFSFNENPSGKFLVPKLKLEIFSSY